VRDQENNLATFRMLLSHIVTLKAPVSKSTQFFNPEHEGSRLHRTSRHKRQQCWANPGFKAARIYEEFQEEAVIFREKVP